MTDEKRPIGDRIAEYLDRVGLIDYTIWRAGSWNAPASTYPDHGRDLTTRRHRDHWHELPGFPEPDFDRMTEADHLRLIAELNEDIYRETLGLPPVERDPDRYPHIGRRESE